MSSSHEAFFLKCAVLIKLIPLPLKHSSFILQKPSNLHHSVDTSSFPFHSFSHFSFHCDLQAPFPVSFLTLLSTFFSSLSINSIMLTLAFHFFQFCFQFHCVLQIHLLNSHHSVDCDSHLSLPFPISHLGLLHIVSR